MICKLCFEKGEELINIDSPEGKEIAKIIYKYFPFCFEQDPNEGMVCQKCWLKVELFHEFYIRIEEIHSNEIIFAECITDHLDITIESNESKPKSPPVKIENENENQSDDDDERNDLNENNYSDDSDYFPNEEPENETANKPKSKKKKNSFKNKNIQQTAKKEEPYQEMTSKGTFQCEMCKTHFLSNNKLQRHIKEIHLVLEFKCAESRCVESYETAEELRQHVIDNHSQQKCPHCNRMINTINYELHIKTRHNSCLEVVCDLCGKVSIDQKSYKNHVRLEHEVQEKAQCDICGLWLKHKDSLRKHMSVRHIQGPQTCGICGKVLANRKALGKHKTVHLAETKDRFKCIVCGRGFRDNTKLKEHSYIHSGITDAYRCNYCDKTFRFSSSRALHRKKAHPLEGKLLFH